MAALTVDFRKNSEPTPADGSPNHHWLWKLHTGLEARLILCISTLPPDSGTLISKWIAKFTLICKEDFGPLSNSIVIFLFSPGKMLLTLFLFQKWLGSPFPEDVWAWWLLMHWLQLQSTPCEALPSVWIGFTWQYSQACGHPGCLYIFYYPTFSFQSTLHLICFDTALLEQPPLSVLNYLFIYLPIYKAWNLVWSFGYCIQSRKCHVRYNSRSLRDTRCALPRLSLACVLQQLLG